MIKRSVGIIGIFLGVLLASVPVLVSEARAGSDGVIPDDVMVLDVLPGWRTGAGTHMAAIRLRMKPGWKTYWRVPGEGGIPPRFDWEGSQNLSAFQVHWPRPKVSYIGGLRSIGYTDEVILPVEFTPQTPGAGLVLKGRIDLGVCQDICIPMSIDFSAALPGDITTPDAQILAALAAQPISASQGGVTFASCITAPISDGLRLTATVGIPSTGSEEVAVIEAADPGIWTSEASATREGSNLIVVSELVPQSNAPFDLDMSSIRITVIGSERAVDIQGCNPG